VHCQAGPRAQGMTIRHSDDPRALRGKCRPAVDFDAPVAGAFDIDRLVLWALFSGLTGRFERNDRSAGFEG
jgi:hypothetical protein